MPAELTPHRRRLQAVLAVGFVGLISSGGPSHADDIEKGRKLAQQHCTRCHIVADMNTVSIGSTPSFGTMVNSTADSAERFRSFYALRPHPAFVRVKGIAPRNDIPSPIAPIHLTPEDVGHIAAFAATLKEQ
ncbi:MAG: hypothetical protein ACR2PM_17625 [Hyphomicrobiales bacterium]